MWCRAALAALSLAFVQQAVARDWPETAGWTIIEGDDSCSIFMEFEGKRGEVSVTVNPASMPNYILELFCIVSRRKSEGPSHVAEGRPGDMVSTHHIEPLRISRTVR